MRQLKVKAWDRYNKVWIGPYTLKQLASDDQFNYDTEVHAICSKFEDFDWVEFIGPKDCKGNEICEGDLCKVKDAMIYSKATKTMVEGIYTVYWNDDRWGLKDLNGDDYDNGSYYDGEDIDWSDCEIVGSRYETPELLEAKA